MAARSSKNKRILSIYQRLCAGKVLRKAEEARRFGVDERSIQRDIDDIRAFLQEHAAETGAAQAVVYDRKKGGFLLSGDPFPLMTNSEILAVSKILLESRAFSRQEMSSVLDKLVSGCVPQKNRKLVSDLLANEKFHYVELTSPASIEEQFWDICSGIQQRNLIELDYQRQEPDSPSVKRIVEPVSILFSEYYFYLNAHIVEKDAREHYVHKYDYPAIFRMDRIKSYQILPEHFHQSYANRFQEGEFRKRVQFMYPGRLQNIRFRYTGANVNAILDRLPTANILRQDAGVYLLEAEVYGNGILMWLLSQGDRVELLAPEQLRHTIKSLLQDTLALYQTPDSSAGF